MIRIVTATALVLSCALAAPLAAQEGAQAGDPMRIAIIVDNSQTPLEPLPQILKNVRYKNGQPLDNVGVQRAINDGKSKLGNSGRLVIRPSGTEPVIRVMAEGDDEKLVNTVVSDIVHALTDAAA